MPSKEQEPGIRPGLLLCLAEEKTYTCTHALTHTPTHVHTHKDSLCATNAAREPSTFLPLLHIPGCMHVNSDRPRFRSHFRYLGYLTEFQFLHQHKLYLSCTSIFLLLSFICSVNELLLSTNHVIIESVSWPRHIMTAL